MTRRTGACLLLLTIDMCNGQGCVPSNCLSMNCHPTSPYDVYNTFGDSDPTFNYVCRQSASSMRVSNECANCPSCLEALDNLQLVIADAVTSCSTYATYGTAACDALDVCLQGGDTTADDLQGGDTTADGQPSSGACGFDQNDLDRNGVYTRPELVDRYNEQLALSVWQPLLNQFDSNSDGAIAAQEWPQDPTRLVLSQLVNVLDAQECSLTGCYNERPHYACDSGLWIFWTGYWVIGTTLGDSDSRILFQSENQATPPRSGWRLPSSGSQTSLSVTNPLAPSPPPAPEDGCMCPEAYPRCAPDLRDEASQYPGGSVGASLAVGSATCVCHGCQSSETTLGRVVESGGSSSNACGCQNCGEEGRRFVACGTSWDASNDDSSSIGSDASNDDSSSIGSDVGSDAGSDSSINIIIGGSAAVGGVVVLAAVVAGVMKHKKATQGRERVTVTRAPNVQMTSSATRAQPAPAQPTAVPVAVPAAVPAAQPRV